MSHTITLRGQRDLWLDFVHKTKKDKKTVWEVLTPFLKKYVAAHNQRLLLVLLPQELTEQLIQTPDPEQYIQETLKERLKK
jgi:hypothetical protein